MFQFPAIPLCISFTHTCTSFIHPSLISTHPNHTPLSMASSSSSMDHRWQWQWWGGHFCPFLMPLWPMTAWTASCQIIHAHAVAVYLCGLLLRAAAIATSASSKSYSTGSSTAWLTQWDGIAGSSSVHVRGISAPFCHHLISHPAGSAIPWLSQWDTFAGDSAGNSHLCHI